jgi:hypothetical protein
LETKSALGFPNLIKNYFVDWYLYTNKCLRFEILLLFHHHKKIHRLITGNSSRLLRLRKWTFEFHKRRGFSWLAEMCTSQEELCSKELFILSPAASHAQNYVHVWKVAVFAANT